MWQENYKWHYDYVRLASDAGFVFEKHKSQSYNKSSIDIDRIVNEKNISAIEQCIPTIIQFTVDKEQTELLDANFIKTFRASQLAVEYLLFCKKYLDNTIVLLKKDQRKLKEENQELSLFVNELKEHVSVLMKNVDEQNNQNGAHKCEQCNKVFSREDYLIAHRNRRHNNVISQQLGSDVFDESNKLKMEIKELKERLNGAEKLMMTTNKEKDDRNVHDILLIQKENHLKLTELQIKFDTLKDHVENELKNSQKDDNLVVVDKPAVEQVCTGNSSREMSTQTDVLEVVVAEVPTQLSQPMSNDLIMSNNFEQVLETKLTSKLQNIEHQLMQSFFDKLNTKTNEDQASGTSNSRASPIKEVIQITSKSDNNNVIVTENKPQIKPRTKFTTKSSNIDADNNDIQTVHVSKITTTSEIGKSEEKAEEIAVSSSDTEIGNFNNTVIKSTDPGPDLQKINVANKPSTASILAKKSMTNLNKIATKREILNNLRDEIENSVQHRLQDIGVSANWNGIPFRSYQKALGSIQHQAGLSKKNIPEFNKIRKDILKILSENIRINKKTTDGRINNKSGLIKRRPPPVEIRNRRMYELTTSDSEIGSENEEKIETINRPEQKQQQYSAVVAELKSLNNEKGNNSSTNKRFGGKNLSIISDDDDEDIISDLSSDFKVEATKRGVLKNYLSTGSLAKKKVLFDLKLSEDNNYNHVGKTDGKLDGGSTTSVASSVLDGTPRVKETSNKVVLEDSLSDFDFSINDNNNIYKLTVS